MMFKVVLLACLVTSCLAASTGSGYGNQLRGHSHTDHGLILHPAKPGVHELAGPPPAPIIPSRTPTPPPPRRTTTTAIPPLGLYGLPDRLPGSSNLNPNFISLPIVLDTPKLETHNTATPATLPTPKGFTPRIPDKKDMPYMPYSIAWGVNNHETGNVFSHSESSSGHDVRGEYKVLLPDGRTQVVSFWADPVSGYNAKVTYQ